MKTRLFPSSLLGATSIVLVTGVAVVSGLHAQNFAIRWHTVDGGGGSSTGGVYTVTGTIGQADAGSMRGGGFTMNGGFWGYLAAIQTPGAPKLNISLTSSNTAIVWWESPSSGFSLQQNTNGLSSMNWSNVAIVPTDNGTIKHVIVNPHPGNRFYRLHKP